MPRVLILVLLLAVAVACSPGKLDAGRLEERLEVQGLGSESVFDPRCRPGVQGWHYVCTFRLGRRVSRAKAAFMVGRDRIKTSSEAMALDLSVGPAPGSPDFERWTSFVQAANAICGERRRDIAAIASSRGKTALVPRLARAARIQSAELFKLQELPPPPGAQFGRLFSQLLDGESRLLSASARFLAAAVRGDAEAAHRAAGEIEVSARRVDKVARGLRLTRCKQTR